MNTGGLRMHRSGLGDTGALLLFPAWMVKRKTIASLALWSLIVSLIIGTASACARSSCRPQWQGASGPRESVSVSPRPPIGPSLEEAAYLTSLREIESSLEAARGAPTASAALARKALLLTSQRGVVDGEPIRIVLRALDAAEEAGFSSLDLVPLGIRHPSPYVRGRVVQLALGFRGPSSWQDSLTAAAGDHPDLVDVGLLRAVRRWVETSEPTLEMVLRSGTSDRRFAAVEGARGLGSPASLELLVEALGDPHAIVRASAAEVLSRDHPEAWERFLERLIDGTRSADGAERQSVARALGRLGWRGVRAGEALRCLSTDPEPSVRREALFALAAVRPGDAVLATVASALSDADMEVREAAIVVLREYRSAAVRYLQPLLAEEFLSSPNTGVRRAAVSALALINPRDPGVVAALQSARSDPDETVRREAEEGLRLTGGQTGQ